MTWVLVPALLLIRPYDVGQVTFIFWASFIHSFQLRSDAPGAELGRHRGYRVDDSRSPTSSCSQSYR